MRVSLLQVLADEPELDCVLPLAVAFVRPPLHALADEAGPLRVRDRAHVERVARELEAVVAELEDQQALRLARGGVRDPPPAERRMHRERLEVRDPVPLARLVPPERTGALAVRLDDHPPERPRLAVRPFDRREQVVARARAPWAEEGIDVGVVVELDEEVDVVRRRPPQLDWLLHRSSVAASMAETSPAAAAEARDTRVAVVLAVAAIAAAALAAHATLLTSNASDEWQRAVRVQVRSGELDVSDAIRTYEEVPLATAPAASQLLADELLKEAHRVTPDVAVTLLQVGSLLAQNAQVPK